ncbi:MAG: putative OsmC-like protein [Candidatus Aldehydirespiratoraceae bacterium]|jgi:uncharacterized OsmC-like protein
MGGIREALDRVSSVVARRPQTGEDTNKSTTTLVSGLACVSEEGEWRLDTDMPAAMGGQGSAPTPGVYGRAALGSCLAMGYKLRSEALGIEVTSIKIDIDADSDMAGMLFLESANPPGYTEVRYHVQIESPAPASDIQRVVDEGDALSPYLDVFARAHAMKRTLTINQEAG